MQETNTIWKLYNPGTGEIRDVPTRSDKQQRRDAQYAKIADNRNQLYEFIKDKYGKFFFCKYDEILEMTRGDTATAFRFLYLCTFVDDDSCEIKYEGRSLKNVSAFHSIFDTTYVTLRKFIIDLTERELIYINSKGNYAVSEYVFSLNLKDGDFKNNSVRTFINVIKYLYKGSYPREHRLLGNIVKLIPFVNRRYNVLCWNVGEYNPELIQLLTTGDICKILHPNSMESGEKKVFNLLKINVKDEPLLIRVKSADVLQYYINPRLCYCGNDPDCLYALYKQFDIAKHQGPLSRPKRMEREVIK